MTGLVDFRILGPIEVGTGEEAVPLGPRKQRLALAVLLSPAGAPVSGDQLIDALWPGTPPRSARSNVYVNVSQLRALLGADRIRGRAQQGYRLHVEPDELDAQRFERAVAVAATRANQGDLVNAGMLLRDALALWRGAVPFGDLGTELALQAEAGRLQQLRLTALELRIDVDLRLGLHRGLVDELPDLIAAHPFRERLRTQLMLALYRCGRRAEALDAYRAAATVLGDEFGIQPGPRLRDLHRAILRDDPELESGNGSAPGTPAADLAVVGAGAPRFLPPGIADFCGRRRDLDRLDEMAAETSRAGVVTVAVLCGMAGAGKTALAVHFAHRAAARFPGGQLHVDLRGYGSSEPMSAVDALAVLLRGLGTPATRIPTDLDQATAVYRASVHDRRVLVILDNARTADQVRALVPTGAGSMVLVTSRDHLNGLAATHAARRLRLDMLEPGESDELLRRIVGANRVEAEAVAGRELTRLCGYLPLAIRVAADQLVDRPERRIATHVAEVRTRRLSSLRVEGEAALGVSAILDQSYAVLPADQQRMFRLLGLLPLPDFTAASAAALASTTTERAGRLLDLLTAASLVQRHPGGRYRLHDLVCEYAAGLAHRPEPSADAGAYAHHLGSIVGNLG